MRRMPVALGAVSIAFGALTTLLMLFAIFGVSAQSDITAEQRHYQIVSTATFSVMAVALIVIGIGLARRKRWSRGAGIAWAIAAIAVVEFEFYVLGRIGGGARTPGMYVMLVVESIFPLAMLMLLVRPSAKDDFV